MDLFIQRVMNGEFPTDDGTDHKMELNGLFYDNVMKAGASLRKLYRTNETFVSRVEAFKKYMEWTPVSNMSLEVYLKNDDTSKKLLEIARQHFAAGNMILSLRACNVALAYAQSQDNFCKLERSIILFKMGDYKNCLKDCESIVKHKWSKNLRVGLDERKTKCVEILGKKRQQEDSNEKVREDIQKRLKYRQNILFRVKQPNPKAPSAESFVNIAYNDIKGRQLEVTRDVPAGTVLVVEEPYVKVLMNELKWDVSHCHNCFRKIRTGIPCNNCVFAFYCNENCKNEAYSSYHQHECGCMAYLHATGTPRYVQSAFRIVLKTGYSELKRIFVTRDPKYFNLVEYAIAGADPETQVYSSDSYLPIFHLVEHSDQNSDIGQYTNIVQAIILTYVLSEYSDFFKVSNNDSSSNENFVEEHFHSFVASIIVRHLQNIPCNSISMDGMEGLDDLSIWNTTKESPEVLASKIKSLKYSQYGSGCYALASLMNHSCVPNVTRVHDLENGRMALVALKSLSAGEELTTSYSRIFLADELAERVGYLKSTYYFTCCCIACVEDWPSISLLNEAQPILCCPKCSKKGSPEYNFQRFAITVEGKCPVCTQKYVLEDVQKEFGQKVSSFYTAYDLVLANKPIDAIRHIAPVIQYFQFNVCPPYSKTFMSHDILKQAIDLTIFFSES